MTEVERHSKKQIRILIVEDDCGFAELMASILEEGGYSCCCASSGGEALIWLVSQCPRLVILDYSLPDMTADSLVERMRELGSNIPFIIVTGKDDASLAVEMMKSGACDSRFMVISSPDRIVAGGVILS